MLVHTFPAYNWIIAMWLMSMKQVLYYLKMENRILNTKKNINGKRGCDYYIAVIYVVALLLATLGTLMIGFPNLVFKAQMWRIEGYEWTSTYSRVNGWIYLFLIVPAPVILHYFIIHRVTKISILLNREHFFVTNA